jgi:oligopeptide/dipeptide ABC transporter ATP-binding protein
LLEVGDLTTVFRRPEGDVRAVDGVSFNVMPGETLALVGESGSGKSVTALSILGLIDPPGEVTGGSVRFQGRELRRLDDADLRSVRGAGIALVFQEPATALNPVFTVGAQIAEVVAANRRMSRRKAWAEAIALLESVGIGEPADRARQYPHQLSGGMRQRVGVAIALAGRPALVIADEPTTALDATIQAEILELLRARQAASGMSILLITHDLGVVASMSNRVAVMYAGRIVEEGPIFRIFDWPAHPYTRVLLAAARGEPHPGSRATGEAGASFPPATAGCPFAPRCPERLPACDKAFPPSAFVANGHEVRCYIYRPEAR